MTFFSSKNNTFSLPNRAPYLFLTLAQLMVALNVVGSKIVVTHVSLLMAVFLRFLFATLVILGLYFLQGNVERSHFILPKKHWCLLISQGLCAGMLFNVFILMGLNYASASMAGMLISLLPAVIALSAVIFLKETLTSFQKAGIGLALIGLMIINQGANTSSGTHGVHELLGVLFLLLALVPETTYYLLSKKHQNKLPVLVFAGLLNAINVICLLPIILIIEPSSFLHIDNITIEVLFLTGVASAFFYVFWAVGIKHVTATRAGMITALCPLMTIIIAWLFLGESISTIQMVGMLFVIASILLSSKATLKNKTRAPHEKA